MISSFYKNRGETLKDAVARFRFENAIADDEKITYAGRLDPMAEGELILLTGDDCKKKESFLGYDKTYDYTILFGVKTDTGDVLGVITKNASVRHVKDIPILKGKLKMKDPKYSSLTWQKAREGKRFKRKEREVCIYKHELLGISEVTQSTIKKYVRDIKKVNGDFRQEEIKELWKTYFTKAPKKFYIAKMRVVVSSGTYIRELVQMIGKKMNIPTTALVILRRKLIKPKFYDWTNKSKK